MFLLITLKQNTKEMCLQSLFEETSVKVGFAHSNSFM